MRHDAGRIRMNLRIVVVALVATAAASHAAEPIPPPEPKKVDAAKQPDTAKTYASEKIPDAHDGRCDVCGSCVCVRKVCVPKPKDREIKKTCWSYKCETVCIPGPSLYCGRRCGTPDECGNWSHESWKPGCAGIVTKKVPVKTEVKRKVPGVEWTPEERCAACRCE